MRRAPVNKSRSRRSFVKRSSRTSALNLAAPRRGGFRL